MAEAPDHIAPAVRAQWMTESEVFDAYLAYEECFGEPHALLACHAAFPLLVNPELVNLIRINFPGEDDVPWMAEPDFLLSPFCRPYENGYYHVDPVAREVLVDVLRSSHPNGRRRINELADFTLAFARDAHVRDPDSPVARTHRWVGWSYLYPEKLADEIARQLDAPVAAGSRQSLRHVEIASMLEITRGPLAEGLPPERFKELAEAAGVVASYYYRGKAAVATYAANEESLAGRWLSRRGPALVPIDEPFTAADPSEAASPAQSTELLYLPEPTPHFVDRVRETENIVPMLLDTQYNLIDQILESDDLERGIETKFSKPVIAIVSPEGVGKRELVLHIARQSEVQRHFDGSMLWIEGGEIASFEEAAKEMTARFGLKMDLEMGIQPLVSAIRSILFERRCLLVFANLDDLIGRDQQGWSFFWEGIWQEPEQLGERSTRTPLAMPSRMLFTAKSLDTTVLNAPFEVELLTLSALSTDDAMDLLSRLQPALSRSQLESLVMASGQSPGDVVRASQQLEEFSGDIDAVRTAIMQDQIVALLQRIVDHQPSPALRSLARWVCLLRRVSPEILRGSLIGEDIAEGSVSSSEFESLLGKLSTAGVLEPDTSFTETSNVRSDVRIAMLSKLTQEDRFSVEQVHQAAIAFYENRESVRDRAEELYHRLQLNRDFDEIGARWMSGVEPYLASSVQELPMPARGYLAQRLGITLSEEEQAAYRQALEEASEPIGDRLKRAEQLLKSKKFVEARELYERIMMALSREGEGQENVEYNRLALTGLAKALEGNKQVEDAGAYFREALSYIVMQEGPEAPGADESRLALAQFFIRNHFDEQAEQTLTDIIDIRSEQLGPDDDLVVEAYAELAAFYEERGRHEEAEAIYRSIEERGEEALSPSVSRAEFEPEVVFVPAGVFLMGSTSEDKDAFEDERPQHQVELSAYWIGKYPVTNAQYQHFVSDTQHQPPNHWKGDEHPSDEGDHPVVQVSWNDAMAYCKWLSEKTGKRYVLPTEAQWEKAARGVDGWIYPWGFEWDPSRLNSSGGETTPVGAFSPAGDSPYGCADMAGNVWERCSDNYDAETYKSRSSETVHDPGGQSSTGRFRVVRGGSFLSLQQVCRCAVRFNTDPNSHNTGGGFRIVLLPFNDAR